MALSRHSLSAVCQPQQVYTQKAPQQPKTISLEFIEMFCEIENDPKAMANRNVDH